MLRSFCRSCWLSRRRNIQYRRLGGNDLVAGIVAGDPWEIQYCFGISVFPLTFTEGLYTPISDYIDYETGEVTVIYDSPENYEWLGYWGELLTDSRYNIIGEGRVSARNSIMYDEVMPNLIKDELTIETTDTVRYIHYPNKDASLGGYLTDSHFLFPLGVSEDKLPCAFMLACYMTDMKSKMVTEDYKANMTEEDYELFVENLNNSYYIPRLFYKGVFAMGNTFRNDMLAGKAVATHIVENTSSVSLCSTASPQRGSL